MEFFSMKTDNHGVTLVTFNRPPVNAVSFKVYPELRELAQTIMKTDETRCVVLTSPPDARAWCGGADLHDFLGLDYQTRLKRYDLINECMPAFFNLDRPVIAAINKHVVGVGLVIASFCDIRVASKKAFFAAPEIDRGVVAAGGGFFMRLNMPQGMIREMIYTGRRYTAEELRPSGFFNYIVPEGQVLAKSMEVAHQIAKKSLPSLKANKLAINEGENLSWEEAYHRTNKASAELTAGKDSKEGIRAFLEKREPTYSDK